MVYPNKIWQFSQKCILHIWQLYSDQEIIVFNESSGQTHVVSFLCLNALELLKCNPLNHKDLLGFLATHNELDPDEKLASYLDKMLLELDSLGLIEPYPM